MITKVRIQGYRLFEDFKLEPNLDSNIIVGKNNSGKSTLLEAMMLALTGRVQGVRATDALNPYWFNQQIVERFFDSKNASRNSNPIPEFRIDLYLEVPDGDLQRMRGINNIDKEDAVGLTIHAYPDPDYLDELEEYLKQPDCPPVLPVEYYRLDWHDFAGNVVTRRPKDFSVAMIDARTIRSDRVMDYYTRQILEDRLEPKQRNEIAVAHRKMRTQLDKGILSDINAALETTSNKNNIPFVGVQVDQSHSTAWENTIIPQIDNIPFPLVGQGSQAIAKTILSVSNNIDQGPMVFIEEPENHLSHTSLRQLLACVDNLRGQRQLFITTHSSYVLNRLGLDRLLLITKGGCTRFTELSPDTIAFFKKASGFDTLRMLLAKRVVLVEGPSDEIVFNRFFKDKNKCEPLDIGVDVIALNAVSFKRALELGAKLDLTMAALRDNDGEAPKHWIDPLKPYLEKGKRQFFVGDTAHGNTLEPQIIKANGKDLVAKILNRSSIKDLEKWMAQNKTEAAISIAEHEDTLNPPAYMVDAISFITSDIAMGK